MKKITLLLVLTAMLLALCACGGEAASVGVVGGADGPTAVSVGRIDADAADPTDEAGEPEAAPKPDDTAQPPADKDTDAAKDEAPKDGAGAANPLLERAMTMIDSDVETLFAAIGEPEDSMYASSCLGEGEDGELYYDGFTVYTYRDLDGYETVYDVMENWQ